MSEKLGLVHILDVLDAIADWKAPYEVAAMLSISVKTAEAMLRSVVRLGRAEYGEPNNTYRAVAFVPAPGSFEQENAYIQMALHDIEDKRGSQRESVQVFREFYRAMKARVKSDAVLATPGER